MNEDTGFSLLPYLIPGRKLRLKISLVAEDPAVLEGAAFPFWSITDSDPLGRLIEAAFETDAGSSLKKLFLWVQKDQYSLGRDELRPLTNQDVDESWQAAFASYAGRREGHSLAIVADQLDQNGRLRPFDPLFFCKARQLYFCPPCPRCGSQLQQCYNDGLLKGAGLEAYSRSLRRYLFCPTCISLGNLDFYSYESARSDPPVVKDRWTLIREFALLLGRSDQKDRLPCIECSSYQECYGPDHLAVSRIVPFSFYPFFMFFFEAMSLHAADYLSLVAGATFDELHAHLGARREPGRMRCVNAVRAESPEVVPSLFEGGDRHFLEVLYLKLSFLGELVHSVFPGEGFARHPELRLSMDHIWVKLADHGSLLPFLWNFKVSCLDTGTGLHRTQPFARVFETDSIHYLGRIWFYTLLVNQKQSVSAVYRSLGAMVDEYSGNDPGSFEASRQGGDEAAFRPENVFWNPDGKEVGRQWYPLWEKALNLGGSLLVDGLRQDRHWSKESLLQELETLRAEAKDALFREGRREDDQAFASETEAIHDILEKILSKWRKGISAAEAPAEAAPAEIEKTVIIPAEGLDKEPPPPSAAGPEEEMAETVIISLADLEKGAAPPSAAAESTEEMPETVIISASLGTGKADRTSPRQAPPDAGLPAQGLPAAGQKETEQPKKKAEAAHSEDILAETVILRVSDIEDEEKNGSD